MDALGTQRLAIRVSVTIVLRWILVGRRKIALNGCLKGMYWMLALASALSMPPPLQVVQSFQVQ
jgi:hypothetical protein